MLILSKKKRQQHAERPVDSAAMQAVDVRGGEVRLMIPASALPPSEVVVYRQELSTDPLKDNPPPVPVGQTGAREISLPLPINGSPQLPAWLQRMLSGGGVAPASQSPNTTWEISFPEASAALSKMLVTGNPDRLLIQELLEYFLTFLNEKSLNRAEKVLNAHRKTIKAKIEALEWAISTPGHPIVLMRTAVGYGPRNSSEATDAGIALGEWLRSNAKRVWTGYRRC